MKTQRGSAYHSLRQGLTLIELLVVLAIIAVLFSLLIPSVMRARQSAARTQSLNNLKQISLASLNYAAAHRGELPSLIPPKTNSMHTTFCLLLPFLDQQPVFDYVQTFQANGSPAPDRTPPVYRNPLDPSIGEYPSILAGGWPLTSYVCNAQVFLTRANMTSTFSDGTSATILYSEQFGWNCRGTMYVYWNTRPRPRSLSGESPWENTAGQARATFADLECGDFHPVETGKTFQVAPSLRNCDPRMPNSSTSSGLQVALADGSTRLLSPMISPSAFWAGVTPDGGEVVPLE